MSPFSSLHQPKITVNSILPNSKNLVFLHALKGVWFWITLNLCSERAIYQFSEVKLNTHFPVILLMNRIAKQVEIHKPRMLYFRYIYIYIYIFTFLFWSCSGSSSFVSYIFTLCSWSTQEQMQYCFSSQWSICLGLVKERNSVLYKETNLLFYKEYLNMQNFGGKFREKRKTFSFFPAAPDHRTSNHFHSLIISSRSCLVHHISMPFSYNHFG